MITVVIALQPGNCNRASAYPAKELRMITAATVTAQYTMLFIIERPKYSNQVNSET